MRWTVYSSLQMSVQGQIPGAYCRTGRGSSAASAVDEDGKSPSNLNTHEQTAVSDYAFACIISSLSAPNGQTKFRQAFSLLLWQFAFQGGDELRRVGADDGIQTQQEIETIKAAS